MLPANVVEVLAILLSQTNTGTIFYHTNDSSLVVSSNDYKVLDPSYCYFSQSEIEIERCEQESIKLQIISELLPNTLTNTRPRYTSNKFLSSRSLIIPRCHRFRSARQIQTGQQPNERYR